MSLTNQLHVKITHLDHATLKRLAKTKGMTVSQVVRHLIRANAKKA